MGSSHYVWDVAIVCGRSHCYCKLECEGECKEYERDSLVGVIK